MQQKPIYIKPAMEEYEVDMTLVVATAASRLPEDDTGKELFPLGGARGRSLSPGRTLSPTGLSGTGPFKY